MRAPCPVLNLGKKKNNNNTFSLAFLVDVESWDAPLPRPPLSSWMIIANSRRPYDSGLLCFDVLEPKPMIYPGVIYRQT